MDKEDRLLVEAVDVTAVGLAQDGAQLNLQNVPHPMAVEPKLARVAGHGVLVLRVVAQGAGYVGFELMEFGAAAAEDPYQRQQDARHHKQHLAQMCRVDRRVKRGRV
jgi:hypothetical protein